MSKKSEKIWIVHTIVAESHDGAPSAPQLRTDSCVFTSLDEARAFVRKEVAKTLSTPDIRVEWLSWKTAQVKIMFNCSSLSSGTVYQQTQLMEIMESLDGEDACRLVSIGD